MEDKKNKMNRRTFLKTAGIGGASIALSAGVGSSSVLAAETSAKTSSQSMPTRILGKTGVAVPILALGGITDWTTNQALLRVAFNMGVTYWDTSDDYINGRSEIGIGQYFEKYPEARKKIFLVTKSYATSQEGLNSSLNTSFERMKTDYVDLFFLHGLRGTNTLTPEIKSWAEQKKKEGKIKFFGFSAHVNSSQILMNASTMGWIDVIMPTYNYRTMFNADITKGIDACAEAGIGLVAMKVIGRGSGGGSSEEQALLKSFTDRGFTLEQAKIKAVWNDERIASSCIAMYSLDILKANIAAATDNRQLSWREMEMLHRLAENTCDQYCLGCMKCAFVMGSDSMIPEVMRYLMYYKSYGDKDRARQHFRKLPDAFKKDLALRNYSPAEALCPQHIRIGDAMREAARILA